MDARQPLYPPPPSTLSHAASDSGAQPILEDGSFFEDAEMPGATTASDESTGGVPAAEPRGKVDARRRPRICGKCGQLQVDLESMCEHACKRSLMRSARPNARKVTSARWPSPRKRCAGSALESQSVGTRAHGRSFTRLKRMRTRSGHGV